MTTEPQHANDVTAARPGTRRAAGPGCLVNAALLLCSLLTCFVVIEAGYRIFDPFPYISQNEINHTEYGNASEYDPFLGWRGVPSAQVGFVTVNSRTWLKNNRQGFRDVEHAQPPSGKPALVFLGDSFTWGYEVEFDEMFVNILREKLPAYEIYNLAHRGYGTDQELLTFRNWRQSGPLSKVILMVSENDVEDNNSDSGSGKAKPMFRLLNGQLVLTGTPVPKQDEWSLPPRQPQFSESWQTRCMEFLLRSHLIHDLAYRILLRVQHIDTTPPPPNPAGEELAVTRRLLEELNREVKARQGQLIVFFIPSKIEIERLATVPPYQKALADACAGLGIRHYDLAPPFKQSWLRSYYRQGMHWNPHGNRVAARAILERLALP